MTFAKLFTRNLIYHRRGNLAVFLGIALGSAVLTGALGLLKAAQGNPIEVQGHTDNVGGDEYNQKLSEARAASVAAWFASHGIPAASLSSKGYGKTKPVADNGSPDGRAKNRRVEISRANCGG